MSDNYVIVYDKFETDFTHYGLTVIRNMIDPGPRIFQRLNAEYTCEFAVPYRDDAVQYLEEENIVKVAGQLFIIRNAVESKDSSGKIVMSVFCEHIFTELLTEYIPLLQYPDATANAIVNGLLAGTRFTGNATAVTTSHQFTVERNTVAWGIKHFIAITKAEMRRDNFNITFKPQIGADNGERISYRKNLKSISRTKESRGIITRLFVYGKDGITLPNPIDSPNIGLYPRPKCGSVTFEDVEDLATLQTKGEAYLATVDSPLLAYEADVIELKDAEGFELGDTVHIDDEDLYIAVSARIVEYEFYPFAPDRSRVVLANFIPSLIDTTVKQMETSRVVEQITTGGGRVNSSWIEGKINTLKNQLIASGAYATAGVIENEGFLLENTDINSPDYGAIYLGPGIIAIASDKAGGDWNWRTFGKGKGFTADEINAGILNAGLIRINSSTTFDEGYDPSQKETPEGAQVKANGAKEAAEAVAVAQAKLAQEEAEAYADGIVSAEEQARIDQAAANLAEAKADAATKANAARLAAEQAAALDATAKAAAAQASAEQAAGAAAQAAKELAEENAKAYADGLVTAEEQARIDQAEANLAAAKSDATTKAVAAEQAAKDAAVLKGVKYKSVYMDNDGFHVDGPKGRVLSQGEFAPGQFGIIAYHSDGSSTAMTPAGFIRKTAQGDKPYNYLMEVGSATSGESGKYFLESTFSTEADVIPLKTITLHSDFRGKDFEATVSLKQDSFYKMENLQNPSAGLRVFNQMPFRSDLEVVSKDIQAGTFTVRARGRMVRWNPTNMEATFWDYGLAFTWSARA